MPYVYGTLGAVQVGPAAFGTNVAPGNNNIQELAQIAVLMSTTPRTLLVYDGSEWQTLAVEGAGGSFSSLAVSGNATIGGTLGVTGALTAGSVSSGGDIIMSAAATKLVMNGGAVTDFIGQATLITGEATVLNTNIAAGDRILLSRAGVNASTALGELSYVINAATSFVITARNPADATTQTGDLSTISYVIVRQT